MTWAAITLPPMPEADEEEVVDALPVLADEPHPIEHPPPPGSLVVSAPQQAMVAAAAGVVAGIVTVAAVRRGRRHPSRRRSSKHGEVVRLAGTRSFLVDVHLIER